MLFDLIVIGGGPAGVTAAVRARELGLVPLGSQWHTLGRPGLPEWERRASGTVEIM